MLLDHIGEAEAAKKVEAAVAADLATRSGVRSTSQIGDALATAVTA
jgi:3-isopropylmalate dehydrogenase